MDQTAAQILEGIPARVRGPGGAIAVLKDGALIGQRVWGYADMARRIPMTADTLLPICSISKQMLCALLYDLEQNPPPALAAHGGAAYVRARLYEMLAEVVPMELIKNDPGLALEHLSNNQSGIRDYWALSVLWGAQPEGRFSIADHGWPMRERLRSCHFPPGTEYSYANTNFHILARVAEQLTRETLGSLLRERVFAPAGMETARLCADTAQLPPPCVGYEGDEARGYVPADNRIEWAGDAGIVASLGDMIAYEQYLDRLTGEPGNWYAAALTPPTYADGTPATYAQGLGHGKIEHVKVVGHSGALRGFRLYRVQAPEERLSVVVLLNHEGSSGAPADEIIRGLLGLKRAETSPVEPDPAWFGTFLDAETQLAITVSQGVKGKVVISYSGSPEPVTLTDPTRAESPGMSAEILGDQLKIRRLKENRNLEASRLALGGAVDYASFDGAYRCAEIDSVFRCDNQGGLLFGSFDGFLGKGPAHLMRYIGQDVWALVCPRGMDAPAPGDWTVVFHRDGNGSVTGATVGCWLARKLEFTRSSWESYLIHPRGLTPLS